MGVCVYTPTHACLLRSPHGLTVTEQELVLLALPGAAAGAACSEHSPGTRGPIAPSLPMAPIAPRLPMSALQVPQPPVPSRVSHAPSARVWVSGGSGQRVPGRGDAQQPRWVKPAQHHPVTQTNPVRRNDQLQCFFRHF